MASSPEGSPPSPPPSSTDKSSPPPVSANSPPPKSSPPPEESKSPPPPSSSPPPPPPPSSPSPPPPSSSSSSSSSSPPPPPPSSSSSSSPPPSPPSPSNNNNSNKNNNATPSSPPPPPPPKLTSENSSSTSSSPKLSPPPPKSSHSSSNSVENGSGSDTQYYPIVIGVSVGVCLLIILVIAIIIATCNRKKKKSNFDNQPMQYYNNFTPFQGKAGGFGYGNAASPALAGQMNNGYQANDHHAISLQPPPGGNAAHGHGGWQQTPSPQGQTPSSSEMSSNNYLAQSFPPPYPSPLGLNQSSFTYEELAIATYGFSQGNLLGQGGFGFVHKGVLPNGKEVAIKSLKSGSGQGQREFQAEVETISRVHHRHLVSLVGYCIAGDKKMLVYEFMPNKTLEFHLHEKGLPIMDWPTRLKIALGAAKGLAYLHEDCNPRIIHRDIKSANILLDYSFEAMVADFGLAKLTEDNNTHVSTRVMGTFGYLAPEYASSGKLTDKSDVFSFGVVLLELITGRRPLDLNSDMDESLVDWARPICASATEDGNFSQLVDPRLENNFVPSEMARMVACASACIRHSARRRPKMRQIVRALEDDVPLDDLNEAMGLGQGSSTSGSNDYDSATYSADMKNFRKLALESQGYGSSNFGNTSEYGLNPSSSSSDSSGPIGQRRP